MKGSVQAGTELNRTAVAREGVLYSRESLEVEEVDGSEEDEVVGWLRRKGRRPGLCALSTGLVSVHLLCSAVSCRALCRCAMK